MIYRVKVLFVEGSSTPDCIIRTFAASPGEAIVAATTQMNAEQLRSVLSLTLL